MQVQTGSNRKPNAPRHYSLVAIASAVTLSVVLLCSGGATMAIAQTGGATTKPVHAFRLSSPVKVDGVLDETDWTRPANNGLIQNEPNNGAEPIHSTDWWIAYDDEALYAAFRLYDSAPDSIDTSVARRDASLLTDEVYLELDTYNDDRNGYIFVVGAGGYLLDAVMYNDGSWDNSWDAVWVTESRVNESGWSAEMRIPFSQLNFKPEDEQTWGVNIVRNCKRLQSTDYLFHRPRNESGHVSRYPDLLGLSGIEPSSNREARIHGVSKGEFLQTNEGNPFNDGSEYGYDVGGDVKWGLTSNLTLNATVNPDFGQVEVDPAVVNLSDFETFFPEKRPFFVQDANIFRFGRDGTNNNWNFNWSDPTLFYSRRVGRSPQLRVNGDADHRESPSGTTILGAAKLTGKIGNLSIGGLTAVTAREHHEMSLGDSFYKELAEPLTSYSLLRANQSFDDGTGSLGLMLTGTERDLSDEKSRMTLARRAYTGGIDGWTYLDDGQRWAMRGYASGSWVKGDAAAIDRKQRSSQRYMHRPDATHLDYDPARTSLGGWSSRMMLNKQKGDYMLNTALGATSPEFEINDLGFQSRADVVNYHMAFGRDWSEPRGIVRSRNANVSTYWTWDFDGTRTGGGMGASAWTQFTNYWSVNASVFYNPERNSNTITRGGPIVRLPINREFNLGFSSDSRKSWRASAHGGASFGGPEAASAWGDLSFSVKPSSALSLSLSPGYYWDHSTSQYVTRVEDATMASTFGNRYVFADLEYTEVSVSTRIDWSFSQWLTLQSYVQPLVAVGDYRGLKEFIEPGTFEFNEYGETDDSSIELNSETGAYEITPSGGGEEFTVSDPDFNFKSLRLNMVLRWEYSPGSTFFLAWTRNGTNFENPGRFDLNRDIGDLLEAPGDDVVLIKVSRWFDF